MESEGEYLRLKIKGTGMSVEEAAKSIGLSRGTLYNYFKMDVLSEDIKELFPNLFDVQNIQIVQEEPIPYLKTRRDKKNVSVEFRVPLVTIKARAGYVKTYESIDLINSLDKYAVPPGVTYTGAIWRYFEVDGDSMEPLLSNGDYLLCSQVPNEDWMNNIRNFYIYVLVTHTDIFIKRIFVKPTNEWVLISDNETKFKQKIFDAATLKELWVFRRLIKKTLRIDKPFKITV